MRNLKKQERGVIEVVAKQFSATGETSSESADAYIVVAGKRFAVDIATLKERGTGRGNAAKPHLRFDKVATRVIEHLQATVNKIVPAGVTVLVTITAPIRLPSKTAAALEGKIQNLLRLRAPGRDEEGTIHGNHVRIRLVRSKSERAPRMIGFVHNPGTDPVQLFDMTSELLELPGAEAKQQARRLVGDRWLVVVSARGIAWLEAYRYIFSQVRIATDFKKIVMVFGDGRVGTLSE